MLLTQFILTNTHFTIALFASLVTFAIAWLYFDSWLNSKDLPSTTLFLGFTALSFSFLAQATIIDQQLLTQSILGTETTTIIKNVTRAIAYIILIIGQIATPLQLLPDYRKEKPTPKTKAIVPFLAIPLMTFFPITLPILAATTGILYLRRATTGLEHHLKPISYGFLTLSLFELLGLGELFRNTNNISLAKFLAPFGPLWIAERLVLIAAIFIFGKWVWSYLLKRFETQLFMIFTTTTLIIFLVTTIIFTYTSMNNLRIDTLDNLKTDVKVLQYTVDSKKSELLSDAQVIAQNPEIITAVTESSRAKLAELTTNTLLAKKHASLVITNDSGAVIMRAEDPERSGESLSNDSLVKRGFLDQSVASIVTKEGVIAPIVAVRAVAPIKSADTIIGTVTVSTEIDNAFVDGVKSATGLDASVYADNIRSATTFISPDKKSRWIGIKEETEKIKDQVLNQSITYTGSVNILNVPYFAAYDPLINVDNNPIGMLFVGKPQVSILQSASKSIEITFITTAILIILSIVPSYFISKYIVEQLA